MLKRVHAHQRHPSNGLMLCLLLHTNAPPEILAVEKISLPPLWSDDSADKTSPTCANVSWHRTWTHRFNWCESLEEKRRWTGSDHREHHRWSFEVPCRSGSKKVKRSETRQQWTTLKLSIWIGFLLQKSTSCHPRGLRKCIQISWVSRVVRRSTHWISNGGKWRKMANWNCWVSHSSSEEPTNYLWCKMSFQMRRSTSSLNTVWLPKWNNWRLMDTIRYNDGLELNTWTKRKSITLWTSTGSSNSCPNSLCSCWRSEDLAHGPSMRDHVYW